MSFLATCCCHVMNHRIWRGSLLMGICVLVTLFSIRRYVNTTAEVRIEGSSIHTKYILTGNPVHHIAFIKVPKAASTTVENIFLRYGDEKNLIFALPRGREGGGAFLTSRYFFPPPQNRTYDITCGHARYNREQFSKVMPNDTKFIGIVRDPFSHFRSFIRFMQPPDVLGIPGPNPVLEYLSRKVKNMKSTGLYDQLCNYMAMYFEFPGELRWNKNENEIQNYLLKLDKELDIVLVVEYLDESIVLMRRILNWDLRHVLYGKLRVNKEVDNRLKFGTIEENIHKSCAYLNHRLYNFFVHKLKEKMERQSPDFYDELAYFRKTRIIYDNFCLTSISEDQNNTEIAFEGSAWNKPFVITRKHCEKLYIHDVTFLDLLIKKHARSLGVLSVKSQFYIA